MIMIDPSRSCTIVCLTRFFALGNWIGLDGFLVLCSCSAVQQSAVRIPSVCVAAPSLWFAVDPSVPALLPFAHSRVAACARLSQILTRALLTLDAALRVDHRLLPPTSAHSPTRVSQTQHRDCTTREQTSDTLRWSDSPTHLTSSADVSRSSIRLIDDLARAAKIHRSSLDSWSARGGSASGISLSAEASTVRRELSSASSSRGREAADALAASNSWGGESCRSAESSSLFPCTLLPFVTRAWSQRFRSAFASPLA